MLEIVFVCIAVLFIALPAFFAVKLTERERSKNVEKCASEISAGSKYQQNEKVEVFEGVAHSSADGKKDGFSTRGIWIGGVFAVGIGFVYYIILTVYSIYVTGSDVDLALSVVHAHQAGLGRLSSLFIMITAGYLAARLSVSQCYFSALLVAMIVILTMFNIPIVIYSIHTNPFIVIAGGLFGAFMYSKLRRSEQVNIG
ncbi:hypothetical protein [Aliamphritea hakodatensis]|uniref:hypothetical protein n=1 Tax=Aliamphritea hakodatensis TaxID=2895352 RepID=UPI0022FD9AE3|nr:hypothetical protein [Aliamphritea hakodatensis]